MQRMLGVSGAHKRFGEVMALSGVDLDIGENEIVGLLGPNGAGKTTLVRAVAGRVALDSGRIELFGREVAAADRRTDLGLVPQEIAVYPLLSAIENLEVFGRFCGVPARELSERVAWALAWTGLGDRARESVKRFSGGMKRRLNIACGVLHRPKLVILDEPTVGVDPQSRERIYDMLVALKSAGTSILLTTHHLDEAEARCDRIIIIDKGKVADSGTLSDLIRRTLGSRRRVSLRLDREPTGPLVGFEVQGRTVRTEVDDASRELAPLLERVAASGCTVEDIEVRGPGLHAVFLALTGKDLRE